jgi:hypothetical protein
MGIPTAIGPRGEPGFALFVRAWHRTNIKSQSVAGDDEALVGVAPLNRDSGQTRGHRTTLGRMRSCADGALLSLCGRYSL